jgi:DNA-binding response OmpR family regulator
VPASNPLFLTTPDTLTRQERALFGFLAREPHRVFTKAELLAALRPATRSTRQLDSLAASLRAKLAAFDGRRSPVNVWGVGYRLEDPRS